MNARKSSFPLQLALSTVLIGGVIAGLVLLGRSSSDAPRAFTESATQRQTSPEPAEATHKNPSIQPKDVSERTRALLPGDAWLVADFAGSIMGPAPFAGQLEGPCADLPPPERVGVALSPSSNAATSIDLQLVVRDVSDSFWECAKKRVLLAGGSEVGDAHGFDVLKSPSGILIRTPTPDLLFLTNESRLASALELARGVGTNALASSEHADQATSINVPMGAPSGLPAPAAELPRLLLTLNLPADWLAAAGNQADASPLRHLRGAALLLLPDGSARASLTCQQPGCEELGEFLLRVKSDLAAELEPTQRAALDSALTAKLVGAGAGKGRLILSWASAQLPLPELAVQLYKKLLVGGTFPLGMPAGGATRQPPVPDR